MIKIKSYQLIEQLQNAITEYNQQFYNKESQNKEINYIDEDIGEISEEDLEKFEKFDLKIDFRYLSAEEIEEFIQGTKEILKYMSLKNLSISGISKDSMKVDISFLENVNEDLKMLQLYHIDLSEENKGIFTKFKNLDSLIIQKANLTKIDILKDLNPNTKLIVEDKNLIKEDTKDIIALMEKHNGKVELDKSLPISKASKAIKDKMIDIVSYMLTKEDMDYQKIDELEVEIPENFDIHNTELNIEEMINTLNNSNNIILKISAKKYKELCDIEKLSVPTYITMNSAKELSTAEIDKFKNIIKVKIYDRISYNQKGSLPYTIEEYRAAKKVMEEILYTVYMPENGTKDREKIIFTQIYKKLAEHMEYDYQALSKENERDEILQKNCRNLYGGLINGKCVCAGYAEILRNTLACVGIESEFIGVAEYLGPGGQINFNDRDAHAWNRVKLDGKVYLTDLTWDRNNIVAKRFPLPYFLKSEKDFGHTEYDLDWAKMNSKLGECKESISDEEQLELFGEKEYQLNLDKAQENVAMSKLSSLVVAASEKNAGKIQGVRKTSLIALANNFNSAMKENDRKDLQQEGEEK